VDSRDDTVPAMKVGLPLMLALLLLAGCTGARYSPQPVRQVLRDYRSVETGMTEKRLFALLGSPDRIGRDGTLHWWVDGAEGELPTHADIDVTLDREAKVASAEVHSDEKLDATGACLGLNATIADFALPAFKNAKSD
jgi:hypothetical protein